MNCSFVEYNKIFLEKSYYWLHDDEIKFLTNTPDFSKEDQKRWFDSLFTKSNYFIYGIMVNEEPVGVCGLKNVTNVDGEYWGYIGEKKYWGKGIGKMMVQFIINKAINLKLNVLYLKVISENIPAIGLYKKFGFIANSKKSNNNMIFFEKTLI